MGIETVHWIDRNAFRRHENWSKVSATVSKVAQPVGSIWSTTGVWRSPGCTWVLERINMRKYSLPKCRFHENSVFARIEWAIWLFNMVLDMARTRIGEPFGFRARCPHIRPPVPSCQVPGRDAIPKPRWSIGAVIHVKQKCLCRLIPYLTQTLKFCVVAFLCGWRWTDML